MEYHLRLIPGGIYNSDVEVIRNSIKINGDKVCSHSIVVSHPEGVSIALQINFALELNAKNPPKEASLNILGFTTNSGRKLRFNIDPFPCTEFTIGAQTLETNGSYKSLGHPMELPKITDNNLLESIKILANYNGSTIKEPELDAVCRLIIATSESIRFSSVAKGINSILGTEAVFSPNSFEIIGWGGHSVAS